MRYIVKRSDSKYMHLVLAVYSHEPWSADMHEATLFTSEDQAHYWAKYRGLSVNGYEVFAVQLVICPPTQTTLGEPE